MDFSLIVEKANTYLHQEENAHFRNEVERLLEKDDRQELNDRFYTDLEFGTGGLRGVIGGGYNRMNPYIVRRSTQGLSNFIKKIPGKREGSVVIAYDSRHFSDTFALEAAKVLCANGIATYLFTALRPTPELSFAVRRLHATAGIVITASHNPKEYNGYKVYWSDGAQIVSPQDREIIDEVRKAGARPEIMSREEAISSGLLRMIDREIDDPFIDMIKSCSLRTGLVQTQGPQFSVVYTSLHGTGAMPVERALGELGFDVISVPEQRNPDGDFSSVKTPNPEEASALRLAMELAAARKSDLAIGTDPDADRLGVAAPDGDIYRLITGNQLGALLADYVFDTRAELGILPKRPVLVKTIVTTELQRLIAESYGAECIDTLTGFKYIGEKIREFESAGNGLEYVFGGEESYGYLVTTEVRDKDAVSAAIMTAEMALYHRSRGRTLFDRLRDLWKKFGYFQEVQLSRSFTGESGLRTMQTLIQHFREVPPQTLAGIPVLKIKDFLSGTTRHTAGPEVHEDIAFPSSNVIQFFLSDQSIVTVRPSGTEPKIKIYISCRGRPGESPDRAREEVQKRIGTISDAISGMLPGS